MGRSLPVLDVLRDDLGPRPVLKAEATLEKEQDRQKTGGPA